MMAPLAIVLWLSFDIADPAIMPIPPMNNAKNLAAADKKSPAEATRSVGARPARVSIENVAAA